jgi:hypothetical protein
MDTYGERDDHRLLLLLTKPRLDSIGWRIVI